MNLPENFKLINFDYEDYLKEEILNAKELEAKFLRNDPYFSLDNYLNKEYIQLTEIFNSFMFFRSDAIIAKLKKEHKLPDYVLCWFISIKDLNREFKRMERNGIYVQRKLILFLVRIHLIIKFSHALMKFYELKHRKANAKLKGQASNDLAGVKDLLNFQERMNYQKQVKGAKKKDIDEVQTKYYKAVSKLFRGDGDVDNLVKMTIEAAKGKTAKTIIKPMFEDSFYYDKNMKQNQVFRSVFGFFKIILQDSGLLTKEEYNERNYQEPDYNIYMASRMKKILL